MKELVTHINKKNNEIKENIPNRLVLYKEITHSYNTLSMLFTESDFQSLVTIGLLFNFLYPALSGSWFNFIHLPAREFYHSLIQSIRIWHKGRILSVYEKLVRFETPSLCRNFPIIDKINSAPRQLFELKANDENHFLFYMSYIVDRCSVISQREAKQLEQSLEQVYNYFTPQRYRIYFENSDSNFYNKVKELSKSITLYQTERELLNERIFKNDINTGYDNSLLLISLLSALVLKPFVMELLWKKLNSFRLYFSIPLHYQNTEFLIGLKENLNNQIENEKKAKYPITRLINVTCIFGFYTLVMIVLRLIIDPDIGRFFAHIPSILFALFCAIRFISFKINFWNDPKDIAERALISLRNVLSCAEDFRKILKIQFCNLGDTSNSYLLLIPHSTEWPKGLIATILHQALEQADIAHMIAGNDVAIVANTKVNKKKQEMFKTHFHKYFQIGQKIFEIKNQFRKLINHLINQEKSLDFWIEEGFITEQKCETKLHIKSDSMDFLGKIYKIFNFEKTLSTQLEIGQIIIGCFIPLTPPKLALLTKNLKGLFSSRNTEIKFFGPIFNKNVKKSKPHNLNDIIFPETKPTIPLLPKTCNIVWDQQSVYPRDKNILPVSGAINRFVKFELPPQCFGGNLDLLRQFKEKSTQMALSQANSQGIKHSTYSEYNFFTGRLQTFHANVKLCGKNKNNRVLLDIKQEEKGGATLYVACAFAYNVH